jgi:hypothetical protein
MKDLVVVITPSDASEEVIRDLFAFHDYGNEFEGCLDLEPPDEWRGEVDLDEWLPLEVEFDSDRVLVNYRLYFIDKESKGLGCVDRQVSGFREPHRLLFPRSDRLPNNSLKRTDQSLRD